MKIKQGSWLLMVAAVVGLSLMSGCATKGPAFTKVENIPPNKGLIYIYRPSAFGGAAVKYTVHVKDKATKRLTNGGYFPYFADVGENEVWAKTEAKSSVTLDVKAGQTYYVKGGVRMGFAVGRPDLAIVPESVGAAEVAECKLIGASEE